MRCRHHDLTLDAATALLLWCLSAAGAAWAVAADAPQDTEGARPALAPAPSFGPAEVTQIQLDALRTNTLINEGIALTFRFASPANRQVTGPLPRFVKMLRSPPYDRLLNHREVEYGPLRVEDDTAYQPVIVTASDGQQAGYLWVMSRQRDGEYKDCWMTDAVLSTEPPARLRFALAAPVGNATEPLV
ncbi:MAG: DUF4864 domain-containing protein [Chromatiaceae bacterium]|jgi:hypothetical protein